MKRTYKLIASRGNEIVFDDRLQADSPRDARREMKKLLGLESLSGPRRLRIVDFGLRIKEGYATDARRIEARSLCSAARVCAADWKTWCCPVVLNPQSAIRNPQSASATSAATATRRPPPPNTCASILVIRTQRFT